MIEKYRKDNGLDYKGWKYILFTRFMRKIRLGFIIPFYFIQDDYDDGIQTLTVFRFGKSTIEKRVWENFDHNYYYSFKMNGFYRNNKTLYKIICCMTKTLKRG